MPMVKSVGPNKAPATKAAAPLTPSQAYKFWNDYFAKTKFKTPIEGENFLSQTVAEMVKANKVDYAEAAIKGYLTYHVEDAQAWMYEMLVLCIESRKGTDAEKVKNEIDIKQTIGFAAHLAKKTKKAIDLRRIADMMFIRGYYGPVGEGRFQTNIAQLVDLAAEIEPADPYAPMMSINLATHDKDPKRMADAAERLLSLGWPGYDDKVRHDVKEQVKNLAEALRVDNKTAEADSLMASLAESEARDVFLRLTWKGEADIDMSVAEPHGATAKFHNPRTVLGGAIIKNGYGSHPEEVYVCPRAFDGPYTIAVEKIVDWVESKPVLEATLEVILHEGTAEEESKSYKIDLAKPEPIVIKLTKGRRKTVLPFVAPAVVGEPKPKDTAKEAKKNAAPTNTQGVPFR